MKMHKVCANPTFLSVNERVKKMQEAGFSTFRLHNGDVLMNMPTDSDVNA
jgi:tryptophanase